MDPFWGLLAQWGPEGLAWTLVATAVWMLFSGRLHTRREYDALEKDRDYWRDAHGTSEGTRSIMAQQIKELLGGQEVVIKVLEGIKKAADGE